MARKAENILKTGAVREETIMLISNFSNNNFIYLVCQIKYSDIALS